MKTAEVQAKVFAFLKQHDAFTLQEVCTAVGAHQFKDYQKVRTDIAWYVKNGWVNKDTLSGYSLVSSRNIKLVKARVQCAARYAENRPHWLALYPEGYEAPVVEKVNSVAPVPEPEWQTISAFDDVSLLERGRAFKVSGVEFADPMEAYREYEALVRTSLLDVRKKMLTR